MSACYFTQIQDSHPRNITRHMNDTPPNPIQPLPVPLWRHAFAMLYDTLLVVPLFMAAAAVWVAILGPTQSIDEPAVPAPLQWLTWVVILTSFFGIFWRRAGQTLGMQAWRIQLVSDSAAPLTWQQVIRRVLGALLAALPLGLGYLWRYVSPQNRYWHDTWSQTHLILLPKRDSR